MAFAVCYTHHTRFDSGGTLLFIPCLENLCKIVTAAEKGEPLDKVVSFNV